MAACQRCGDARPDSGAGFCSCDSGGSFHEQAEHIDGHMKHSDPEEHHTKFDKFTVRFYGDTAIVNGSVIALNPPGRCWRGRSLPMYWFFAMTVAGGECAGACGSARNRKTRSTRCVYSHWAIGRRDFVNRTLRHAQRYGNVHDIVFIV